MVSPLCEFCGAAGATPSPGNAGDMSGTHRGKSLCAFSRELSRHSENDSLDDYQK